MFFGLMIFSPRHRMQVRGWNLQNLKNLQSFWNWTSRVNETWPMCLHTTIICWLYLGSAFTQFICIQMINKCWWPNPDTYWEVNQIIFFPFQQWLNYSVQCDSVSGSCVQPIKTCQCLCCWGAFKCLATVCVYVLKQITIFDVDLSVIYFCN